MKLTLRQMEIFLNVVASGHLTNVAKDMKLSQSAISMSIKELENILGRPVFLTVSIKSLFSMKWAVHSIKRSIPSLKSFQILSMNSRTLKTRE